MDKKLADVQWEKKSEDIKEDPEYIKLKQKMEEINDLKEQQARELELKERRPIR